MTTHPALTCRNWPAGTRVRCIDASTLVNIAFGDELTVDIDCGEWLHFRELRGCGSYSSHRFKPVVRVKAPTRRIHCCNKTVLSRCKGCPHLVRILPNYTVGPSC